ncbi:nitrogenase stabilizing/protective protein NifW [Acuticoccus sediminis]|uniref:Nitrogenase-stabilizing/protective protein NifW n=1 Tax=Acuticoccus sediminis TaxID=2184697 RepID=A0A8B2NU93_9HYPH|nr:nitrogenase stabilizing/protective protein NifW [Acuticoccus sediminis]RAI00733.1 nitrogenase stabilizing/protective protein NifW [Acuticoccus sediminis]
MSVLDELSRLSSAEEFFALLDVSYEPAVVHVARLHILKRMGQHLASAQAEGTFDGLSDEDIRRRCRACLADAYDEFVTSSPIAERLFKVHQDAVAPKIEPERPFVPLSALVVGP